jgi:hypothetical protein
VPVAQEQDGVVPATAEQPMIVVQVVAPSTRCWKALETLRFPAPVMVADSGTVPRTMSGTVVRVTLAGLATRVVTSAEVALKPATSVARARRRWSPSATSVVFHEQEYGAVVSVQSVVQEPEPAGACSRRTLATPLAESLAVACTVTVPETVAPGLVTVTVGGW